MTNRPIPTSNFKPALLNFDAMASLDEQKDCYQLSTRTVSMLLSQIESMRWATRWHHPGPPAIGLTPAEAKTAAAWVGTAALELMTNNCEAGCVLYPAYSPLIQYAPNDPFQTPNYTPSGYVLPPWYTNPAIPLPGVQPNDAMVNLLSLATVPVAALAAGFPRFHFEFSGEGEVEIELVRIPQGGLALITMDSSPVGAKLLNLNSQGVADLLSLETLLSIFGLVTSFNIVSTTTIEWEVTTPGLHHIDVTFIPNVGGSTLLGFGGGLRRVSLCGLSPVEVNSVPQFRVNGCELQWRPSSGSDWVDLVDISTCAIPGATGPAGPAGPQGPQGAPGTPGQDCDCTGVNDGLRCRSAWGWAYLLWQDHLRQVFLVAKQYIEANPTTGYALALEDAKLAWGYPLTGQALTDFESMFDSLWAWGNPSSGGSLLSLSAVLDGTWADYVAAMAQELYFSLTSEGVMTSAALAAFRTRLTEINDGPPLSFFVASAYIIPDGAAQFLMRDAAYAYVDAADCSAFVDRHGSWCHVFDFTTSMNGWSLYGPGQGEWVEGSGWECRAVTLGGQQRSLAQITISFPETVITDIGFAYDYVPGTQDPSGIVEARAIFIDGAAVKKETHPQPAASSEIIWGGNELATNLIVDLQPAFGASDGSGRIKSMTVHGKGTNPFGTDNC